MSEECKKQVEESAGRQAMYLVVEVRDKALEVVSLTRTNLDPFLPRDTDGCEPLPEQQPEWPEYYSNMRIELSAIMSCLKSIERYVRMVEV